MDGVNKTLYIPLYGKAYVSKKGIILHDAMAEKIWAAEGFALKGKSKSKWLAYYMGMRAAVFDHWLIGQMQLQPDAVIVHIGCGMDSRISRVGSGGHQWFDIDFPQVIEERRKYYSETHDYRMLGLDVRNPDWLADIPQQRNAIVIMEGVSMYLRPEELQDSLAAMVSHFSQVSVLMDCYSSFAARASQYKNPINDVGVNRVYGMDDPKAPETGTGLSLVKEHDMTPENLIGELTAMEQALFRKLYAGAMARKLYRLYEYKG